MTPLEYHTDESNHGSYQYALYTDIIDYFVRESMDTDSYLKNTSRFKIIEHVKNGIKKLNKQVFKDIRAMEIAVPDSLYFQLPHNYTSYVRTSVVVLDEATNSYRLKTLNRNKSVNIAKGYLQDHNFELIFDESGRILTADAYNTYNKPYSKYQFDSGAFVDTSKFSKYGEVRIDERRGKISFSSDLLGKIIVLEYLSDGLQWDLYEDEPIKIHKDLTETLINWVYYTLVQFRKSVPDNVKERALRRFKTTMHDAKIDRANISMIGISTVINAYSKM